MPKAYKILKQKKIFSKKFIHLIDYTLELADKRKVRRQIFEHPGSVVVIPKVSRNRYLLIRQFRFAARGWLWEWVAGGREKGESLKQAANRELSEEIGHKARKLSPMISFYPSPGVSSEVMHLFLAEGLYPAEGQKDEDEEIEVHEFSIDEIGRMIRKGQIRDAKTILGFLWLKKSACIS